MKRTSKQMIEKWDNLQRSITNDSLNTIHIIPEYYKKLISQFDLMLIEMNERGYDIGLRSEIRFKINKIKQELK